MTRLVTARVTTPAPHRAAPTGPRCAIAAAMANHSFEWSAARVSRGIVASSSGLGDSAIGLEHLAVQGAQTLADLPDAAPAPA